MSTEGRAVGEPDPLEAIRVHTERVNLHLERLLIYHDEQFHKYMTHAFGDEWRDWPYRAVVIYARSWKLGIVRGEETA